MRDLPAIESLDFHLFARSVPVSHMYAHIAEFGKPVEIGGLTILPGDLLQGDRHGVQTIPIPIATEIPRMASDILREERQLKEICRSPKFSLKKLELKLQDLPGDGVEMRLDGR